MGFTQKVVTLSPNMGLIKVIIPRFLSAIISQGETTEYVCNLRDDVSFRHFTKGAAK